MGLWMVLTQIHSAQVGSIDRATTSRPKEAQSVPYCFLKQTLYLFASSFACAILKLHHRVGHIYGPTRRDSAQPSGATNEMKEVLE